MSVERLEARMLLAGDLVAHWRAHDLRDAVADGAPIDGWSDLVGGVVAASEGDPALVHDGVNGRAVVQFSGGNSTDLFRVPAEQNPIAGADDFSVAVTFTTTSANLSGDGGQWFNGSGLVDGSRLGIATDWGLSINSRGQISAGMGDGFGIPATTVNSSATGLNDGQLHSVLLVRQAGELSVYVDDTPPVSDSGASVKPRSDAIDLTIGALQTRQGQFEGEIAEVRVYDGSLTAAEVSSVQAEISGYYNNAPPVAADDRFTGDEDEWLFTAGQSVLSNDEDAEGDSLTAQVVQTTAHGSLTLKEDGSFIYVPSDDFFGTDTFTYVANDFRPSNVATVTLEIAPAYDAVDTEPDQYKALPNEVLQVVSVDGLLANDSNPDAVNRTVVLLRDVANGQLVLRPDGAFSFDAGGFAGVTSFTYQVDDGTQLSPAETVLLVVNTPPTGQGDDYQLTEDTTFAAVAADGVLANDQDADGDTMTVSAVQLPEHGTLTLERDGTFSYEPELNYSGEDQFTYRIQDGTDDSADVTVNLLIAAVDDAPLAQSDAFFGVRDEPIIAAVDRGVLANDIDVDSNQLTAEVTQMPNDGDLQLAPDGSFQYTPNVGFVGTDRFLYRTLDGNSSSEVVEVSLFVGSSPLRISEFMAGNGSGLETRTRASVDDSYSGATQTPDWIEIQNLSNSPLDLGGFHLTDDRNNLKQWAIPDGTIIGGSASMVIYATHLDIRDSNLDETGAFHANFTLSLNGEYLAITSPDGNVQHEYANRYPEQFPDVAYGLALDGTAGYLVHATPGAENSAIYPGIVADTRFSVDRGWYDEPFDVEISTQTEGAEIRYTYDGSVPSTSNGTVYAGPIRIDRTTTLRAAAFLDGHLSSNVDTQTYLYLDQVIQQPAAPTTGPSQTAVAFPERWRSFRADYEMDTEITESALYTERMRDALLALPSLSLTLDQEDIFGARGLYSNPGSTNEASTSAELIYPDGTTGFQIDAGARMQGGASRNTEHVKHSMSLRFREEYGEANLDFPVFPDSPVTNFNSLHLRARYNNSWIHWDQGQRNRGSMIREAWMRDSMMAAGDISAGHGSYVHLYLNGLYWGVYEMHERQDASHYAAYFGGEEFEYDAYNATSLVDGTRDSFSDLRDTVNGQDWEQIQQVLDVDNHIMYTIVNEYGGNQDLKNDGNWRFVGGGPNRKPWRFYVWDAERVLENAGQRGTSPVNDLLGFRRQLDDIPEYMIRFADHIHRLLYNDGPLTEEATAARWMRRANELESALVAESARWGDLKQRTPLTLEGEWRTEQNRLLESYFPDRTANVITNFRRSGFYPDTEAPEFLVDGARKHGGLIDSNSSIQFENPNAGEIGRILYTTDGSDPRLEGGAVSPVAFEYEGAALLLEQTANLKARILNGEEWSALTDARFLLETPAGADNLAITEVNYHPHDALTQFGEPDLTDGEFEFVEIANISDVAIDLAGVQFREILREGGAEGITFTFHAQLLAPGERLVVGRNVDALTDRYGDSFRIAAGDDGVGGINGQWGGGRLSNGGETISLYAADQSIIRQFRYDDQGSWPGRADGIGSTLVIVDPTGPSADARNWQASDVIGGTPGSDEDTRSRDVVVNEILTNSDAPLIDQLELLNTSNEPVDVSHWYVSDSSANLLKFQFADQTPAVPAGGYLVLDETQLGFGFKGQENDDIWLVAADESGRPQSFVDSFSFLATASDVSLGRWPNGQGDLFPQISSSFGADNAGPSFGGVIISELQYNPAIPDGGDLTDHDLEFVEIWNASATPLDLSGWRLDKAIDLTFATGTTLASSQGLVAVSFDPVADAAMSQTFRANYGIDQTVRLVGPFVGVLDNGGEKLELQRPVPTDLDNSEFILVDRVRYDDDAPWPIQADGSGFSLHRVDAQSYGDLRSSWVDQTPSPGTTSFGTPPGDLNGDGQVDVADIDRLITGIRNQDNQFDLNGDNQTNVDDLSFFVQNTLGTSIGDANLDGRFDSNDLVLVAQAAEFEDGIAGNSTWAEGDWNGDGDFGTSDIVLAFRIGNYARNAAALIHREVAKDVAASIEPAEHARAPQRIATEDVELGLVEDRRAISLDLAARDLLFADFETVEMREFSLREAGDQADDLL